MRAAINKNINTAQKLNCTNCSQTTGERLVSVVTSLGLGRLAGGAHSRKLGAVGSKPPLQHNSMLSQQFRLIVH